jgi:GNAT superfamily N-acetyltransferase
MVDIASVEVEALLALTIDAGWPHRAADWSFLLAHGSGLAAVDDIGRTLGCIWWTLYDPGAARLGMMMTSPRLQAQGAGRWLAQAALARLDGRVVGITAPSATRRLFRALGFGAERRLEKWEGVAQAPADVAPSEASIRPLRSDDLRPLLALDRAALGCGRGDVLTGLAAGSDGVVLERDGAVQGFALARAFGRGRVLGPVIAASDADAAALAAPLIRAADDQILRCDAPRAPGAFARLLAASGLGVIDVNAALVRGGGAFAPCDPEGPRCFALASQTLG